MLAEVRADQTPVVRPFVERVGGAVHADESVSAPNELDERILLSGRERQLAARQREHDHVVVAKIVRTERRQILGRGDRELTARRREIGHRLACRGDRVVPERRRCGHHQHARPRCRSARRGRDRRRSRRVAGTASARQADAGERRRLPPGHRAITVGGSRPRGGRSRFSRR